MTIDKNLLAILACPRCKGRLELQDQSLLCPPCGLKYPIRVGIPVLLVEEAEKVGE